MKVSSIEIFGVKAVTLYIGNIIDMILNYVENKTMCFTS